ncbi:glycoside hydrolase family 6 protein [Nocardioides sp. SYSU DS0651]|uniref:glycoside hydrolase family 6 protein n=1 Tax=Nocardioides sp. SYSU DS0651 TaxID=3415955 RepID=UPI003F4AFCAC
MKNRLRVLVPVAVTLLLALSLVGPSDAARSPHPSNPRNPLAKAGPWKYSTITTRANPEMINYRGERNATRRAALAKIAKTPKARWFANCGSCNVANVRNSVASYVKDARRSDPDALVQLAIFGLWPDGEVRNGKRPRMSWSMERYQRWIKQIAAGIGNARVAIILEPDLAISANHGNDGREMPDPTPGIRKRMTAWSAKYLSAKLRGEAIYIDAGSADWLYVDEAVRLLRASGIQHVRGFALGATHYDSVADNVAFAKRLSSALARHGIRGKKAVIDTADNGTPFTWKQWDARWGRKFRSTGNLYYQFDNTPTCRSRTERVCQTLGHRPTWNPVGREAGKVGLTRNRPELRRDALRLVDGYLWFGRGWRWMQQGGNDAQTKGRSIRMATYTKFRQAG